MPLPASEARYDLRPDGDGPGTRTWTVYDVFTGWPAEVNGVPQTGLDVEQADDLVDLLNYQDVRRRGLL